MARVTGPLFSLDASGSVGGAITFSKWKGRNYLRRRVIPSNPKSGPQVGRRAMMKFLAQNWAALSIADKATWQVLADELIASPFNGYASHNMKRWHNFLCPGQSYPIVEAGLDSDYALTAAAWEENRIKLTLAGTDPAAGWGILFHAYASTGLDLTVANTVIVLFHPVASPAYVYWTPPTVATWWFDTMVFTQDGKKAAAGGEQSAAP